MMLGTKDEYARLAVAFAAVLPRQEAKKAVAALYDISEDMAWRMIVHGRFLTRPAKKKKGQRHDA